MEYWFVAELQSMMFGCGDWRSPRVDSARLLEQIVLEQVTIVARAAEDLRLGDLLLAISRNRPLFARYVAFAKAADRAVKSNCEDGVAESADGKRVAAIRRCVLVFDVTGELTALLDSDEIEETKRKRMVVAAETSSRLSREDYLRYAECRRVSFCSRNQQLHMDSSKFAEWLFSAGRPCSGAAVAGQIEMELLSFLASETVAQMVTAALAVRRECAFAERAPVGAPRSAAVALLAERLRQKQAGAADPPLSIDEGAALQPSHLREALRRLQCARSLHVCARRPSCASIFL